MIMTQSALPFQYQAEKTDSGLTGFAGLPLYLDLAKQSGLVQYISQTLKTKMRGWTDAEMILSLILLNLAGGDCISDIDRLEQDAGLRTLLMQFAKHGMKRKKPWITLQCSNSPLFATISFSRRGGKTCRRHSIYS